MNAHRQSNMTYFVQLGAAGSSVDVVTFQIRQSDDLSSRSRRSKVKKVNSFSSIQDFYLKDNLHDSTTTQTDGEPQ